MSPVGLNQLSMPLMAASFGQGDKGRITHTEDYTWKHLTDAVQNPTDATISHADYLGLSDIARNSLKAKDPFVIFGQFEGKARNKNSVKSRSAATLDIDSDATNLIQSLDGAEERGITIRGVVPFSYVGHTTRTHTTESPRLRLLIPFSRPVSPSEYPHCVRALGKLFCIPVLDLSCVQPERLMFLPTPNKGAPYSYWSSFGNGYVNPDTLLATIPHNVIDEVIEPAHKSAPDNLTRAVNLARVNNETISDLRNALVAIVEGYNKNAYGYEYWVSVLQNLKSLDEVGRELALEFSKQLHDWKCDEEEFNRKWNDDLIGDRSDYTSIFKKAQTLGWINPRRGHLLGIQTDYQMLVDRTDTGNANLLVKLTNGDLRYVTEKRIWLGWQNNKWIWDDSGSIAQSMALRIAEEYQKEATQYYHQSQNAVNTPADRTRIERTAASIAKWAQQCRNKRALDNMLAVAAKFPEVKLSLKDLDTDRRLLGVENGVVDLRTGNFRPAARADLVTKRSGLPFNPKALAPGWINFVEQITGRPISAKFDPITEDVIANTVGQFELRPELSHYLRKALGYSLTGLTEQHKLFVCVGAGSNGKNVLLDIVKWVLGDYGVSIPPAVMLETHQNNDPERASSVAARLAGARVAISSESKPGQKFDVATIKSHTGDGYMIARFLNQNAFEFDITHKLWLMTNSVPTLDHLDGAVRGRLHIIPFDMKWNRPGESDRNPALPEGDPALTDTLRSEAEGILAWLVAGAVDYANEGLTPPKQVQNMTRTYLNDQDSLGRWLGQYEKCDPKQGATAKTLFDEFHCWCEEEGNDNSYTQKSFGQAIKLHGIASVKREAGMYYGIIRRK